MDSQNNSNYNNYNNSYNPPVDYSGYAGGNNIPVNYNGYANGNNSSVNYNNYVNGNNPPVDYNGYAGGDRRGQTSSHITASMILGLFSAILLGISMFVPAMDFSKFHESVQIRYSFMKICENVGLISDMWRGIPIGILIAAALMLVLSFIRIPPLKAIPCVIIVSLIILAIVDFGNVLAFARELIARFVSIKVSEEPIGVGTVLSSFGAGFYLLAAGLVCGIVSCFVSNGSE